MRRPVPALLALSTLALAGCAPTADDIQATVDGRAAYDDAMALREDVVGAGLDCPGADQLRAPADPETTYLDCANGRTAMAVTDSEERMQGLLSTLSSEQGASFLHADNWVVISRDEAPLQQLQDELGGDITTNP